MTDDGKRFEVGMTSDEWIEVFRKAQEAPPDPLTEEAEWDADEADAYEDDQWDE